MIDNPYLFACEWYRPEAIFAAINRLRDPLTGEKQNEIPADCRSTLRNI